MLLSSFVRKKNFEERKDVFSRYVTKIGFSCFRTSDGLSAAVAEGVFQCMGQIASLQISSSCQFQWPKFFICDLMKSLKGLSNMM